MRNSRKWWRHPGWAKMVRDNKDPKKKITYDMYLERYPGRGEKVIDWWQKTQDRIDGIRHPRIENRTPRELLLRDIKNSQKNYQFRNFSYKRESMGCPACFRQCRLKTDIDADQSMRYLYMFRLVPLSEIVDRNDIKSVKEAYDCEEMWDESKVVALCHVCFSGRNTKMVIAAIKRYMKMIPSFDQFVYDPPMDEFPKKKLEPSDPGYIDPGLIFTPHVPEPDPADDRF